MTVRNAVGLNRDLETSNSLYRQALINGNFDVWQRGTSFTSATTPANSDDTYLADRWILLSDGNDIVDVYRSTIAPSGSKRSCRFQIETANKKFGTLQIIENEEAIKFTGKTVSLSFQAKTVSGALENLRAAVISWDGTADTVTSDVVSAWNAEGTNPTLATNWTYENTPANLVLSDDFQTFTIEGISVDTSGMTNLAVFIWLDDTDGAVNDYMYLTQVQLCAGDITLPFQPSCYTDELLLCQRYYREIRSILAGAATTAWIYAGMPYLVPMRASPTISLSAKMTITDTAADYTQSSTSSMTVAGNEKYFHTSFGNFSGLTAGKTYIVHAVTGGKIRCDAEL